MVPEAPRRAAHGSGVLSAFHPRKSASRRFSKAQPASHTYIANIGCGAAAFPDLKEMPMDSKLANFDLTATPRRRGRSPKRKTRITIYLDDEVLDEFRSRAERTGTGYQTLINAALRLRLGGTEGMPSVA
jgi:uncharacterized protein (DUF4415 family)